MSHCPQCNKLMRGICRYCQPQEYIDMQGRAITDLVNDMKPQRQWVGLDFESIEDCFPDGGGSNEYGEAVVSPQWLHDFAHALEAKLKEKNT